jgi:hypothetical protein
MPDKSILSENMGDLRRHLDTAGTGIGYRGTAPNAVEGVAATLQQRGSRYGDFTDHARIAQDLQDVMRQAGRKVSGEGWARCNAVQRQALTVIADKIARILNGDPNYADNWHDIQGYAKLVEDRLEDKA